MEVEPPESISRTTKKGSKKSGFSLSRLRSKFLKAGLWENLPDFREMGGKLRVNS